MAPDILARRIDELTRFCQQLQQALTGFEAVIDRENEAIRRSDINELEIITQEKIAFGMAVEDKSQKIRHAIDEVASAMEVESDPDQPLQLDGLMLKLQQKFKGSLDKALDRLDHQIKSLAAERFKIFPKLESNAYMVRKLLQYHRETYVFWQAVASDSESVYGKTGRAVTPAKKSILTVRT